MQHNRQTHQHSARAVRAGRGSDRAAQGPTREAPPKERRHYESGRVSLPLARLCAERVGGLPMTAAQDTRGVALYHSTLGARVA